MQKLTEFQKNLISKNYKEIKCVLSSIYKSRQIASEAMSFLPEITLYYDENKRKGMKYVNFSYMMCRNRMFDQYRKNQRKNKNTISIDGLSSCIFSEKNIDFVEWEDVKNAIIDQINYFFPRSKSFRINYLNNIYRILVLDYLIPLADDKMFSSRREAMRLKKSVASKIGFRLHKIDLFVKSDRMKQFISKFIPNIHSV